MTQQWSLIGSLTSVFRTRSCQLQAKRSITERLQPSVEKRVGCTMNCESPKSVMSSLNLDPAGFGFGQLLSHSGCFALKSPVIDIFAKFFSAAVSMCERDSKKKGWVLVWRSVAKEENVRRGEFERDALNVYVFQLWVTSHPEVVPNIDKKSTVGALGPITAKEREIRYCEVAVRRAMWSKPCFAQTHYIALPITHQFAAQVVQFRKEALTI